MSCTNSSATTSRTLRILGDLCGQELLTPKYIATNAKDAAGRPPSTPRADYNSLMLPRMTVRVKGTTGLLVAAALITVFLVYVPAYRLFFLISLGLGVIIAAILYLRNKYVPVKEKDVENKRPLGLD